MRDPATSITWEYNRVRINDDEFQREMANFGAEGWELVCVHRLDSSGLRSPAIEAYFKRRLLPVQTSVGKRKLLQVEGSPRVPPTEPS